MKADQGQQFLSAEIFSKSDFWRCQSVLKLGEGIFGEICMRNEGKFGFFQVMSS